VDPTDVRFWHRTQRIGVALTVACVAFVLVYLVLTWSHGHRVAMLAVAAVCLVTAPLLLLPPARRVVATRWRTPFFLVWSGLIIAVVTALVVLDGGTARSPLVSLYFLPLVFATLAYPMVPMVAVAIAIVATFIVTSIAGGDADASTVVIACSLSAAAVMCATITRLHQRQRAELNRVSRADPLTGCLNRRGLEERLDAELAEAQRHARNLSLLVIDLDGFKAVNDRDGHAAGDELLVWTVAQIVGSVRPLDAVGRLGGDEFAVVLPDTAGDAAHEVADRVERALAERNAASTGVATYPRDGFSAAELHAAADARLYEAKRGLARC
jgi:diguanylate cyclase (GGDEF)-like protein